MTFYAGMRPVEGRALSPEQIIPEYNEILINRQLDSSGVVALPKKGYAADRRQEWLQDGYTHFEIEHFQDLRLD